MLERRLPWVDRALLFGAGALSLLATLANPYGTGMWRFLADTVGVSRPHIADWKPAWSSVALVVPLVCVTLVAGVALALRSRRPGPTRVAVATALWCLALAVSRLDAFFAIAVSTLLAVPIADAVKRWLRGRVQPAQPPSELLGRALINGAVVVVLLAVATAGVRSNASCLSFGDPATAPEPGAVEFIRQSGLRGRFLTYYNDGEYAIWHLAPSVRISMDGRRETVYTDAIVDAHFRFYAAPEQAPEFPDTIGADVVWLPNAFRAGPALESGRWQPAFVGPVSSIWTREPPVPRARPDSQSRAGKRCFPAL
jgi:hypothetical protein